MDDENEDEMVMLEKIFNNQISESIHKVKV